MASTFPLPRDRRRAVLIGIAALALVALALIAGKALMAQIAGDRGIAPVAASGDIQVGGIEVDVTAKTPEEAREQGWREAMKLAWKKVGGPDIPEGQLYSLVSSVVVESEELGPHRYIGRLGIVFDRARAGGLLGKGEAIKRSAPLLLVPVTFSAGTETVYEIRNPWQRAWAEYQPGASRIDYVRPVGAGSDSLLLTYGQTTRRSRTWWRNVLDQFGASDVLIAIADLKHQYPGGPVQGTFTARYGPDDTFLGSFTMTAPSQAALPEMLGQAVLRMNALYEQALSDGKLKPDPTLNLGTPQIDPMIQQLIELGRAADAQARAAAATQNTATPVATDSAAPTVINTFTVQFASPDAKAVDAALGAMRGISGVRGAATTSLAMGGISVMRVTYAGSIDELARELRGKGYSVVVGSNALSIRR